MTDFLANGSRLRTLLNAGRNGAGRLTLRCGVIAGLTLVAGCVVTEQPDSVADEQSVQRADITMATPWEPPVRLYTEETEPVPPKPPPLPVPRPIAKLPSTPQPAQDPEPPAVPTLPDVATPAEPGPSLALPLETETDTGPENRVGPGTVNTQTAAVPDRAEEDPGTDPGWLIGLDQEGTIYLLGEPSMRIEQPPARVWQYNGNNCTLRLFLYLDMVTVRYRTLFYEIRGVDAVDIDAKRRCVSWLLADRSNDS